MSLKTEKAVWSLDRRLTRDVSWARRRAIRRDVRAHLRTAASEVGEPEALRRFGDLREIAGDYRTTAGRSSDAVLVDRGARAALFVALGLLALTVIRIPTFGMVDTFDAFTDKQEWHWQLWRLGELSGDLRTRTPFEATVYSYSFILVPLVAFVVSSRAWRLATRACRRKPAAAPR